MKAPERQVIDAVLRTDVQCAQGVGIHESSDRPGLLGLVFVDGERRVFAVAEMTPKQAEALAADLLRAAQSARARESGLEGRG